MENKLIVLGKKEDDLQKEIGYLETEIRKKLLSSSSQSQNKSSTMYIDDHFAHFLVKTYDIKKNSTKWFDGTVVLEDFSINTKRVFNKSDFCEIKKDSFKIKIFQRNLKSLDDDFKSQKRPFKNSLKFKFQNLSKKF